LKYKNKMVERPHTRQLMDLSKVKDSEGVILRYGWFGTLWIGISIFFTIVFFPLGMCFHVIKVVSEYERAVLFRLGRLVSGGGKGPGLFCVIPWTDEFILVDLRTKTFDVPPQEILTKDSVTVAVDAVVFFRVQDATMSIANVDNADKATRLLSQTTLRNMLGTKTLAEVLTDREQISLGMKNILDSATDPWGIKVERVEIKDVKLPVRLQRVMAAEAEAARDARAKVIAAEGEMNASRKLKEAADVMSGNPNSLQLRYLQTLNAISTDQNSTIIFPLPISMMESFCKE